QAGDGIRDLTVTGVQTCALPISAASLYASLERDCRAGARQVSNAESFVCRRAWRALVAEQSVRHHDQSKLEYLFYCSEQLDLLLQRAANTVSAPAERRIDGHGVLHLVALY